MGMRIPKALEAAILAQAGVSPLTPASSEAEFQAAVEREADRYDWTFYHTHDSRRSESGFPDLVAIRGRVQLVAELKVKRNKTSPAQEKWLALFEAVGARVFRWRPENWFEIVKELK